MRNPTVSVELTSEEILMQSAACAIASAVIPHPEEIMNILTSNESETFVHAALEIVKRNPQWNTYLNKMMVVCRNARTTENL